MMVATIRSHAAFYSQSMTALRYAARARHIRNVPIKNSDASGTGDEGGVGSSKMKHTLAEVSRLRTQLDQRTEDFQRLCSELAVLQQAQARSSEPSTPGDSQREEYYKAKISEMAEQTENEKRELQEHTRCLIHGHESALAEREREFESVQSKMRRSYEKQLASLQEDHKSNLIYRKETEFNQQELAAELEQAQSDIRKLKSALRETLKTHKQGKEEWATKKEEWDKEKEEWGKEKGQFIAALQRVSASRARTKAQIGDLVEENEGLRAAALAWQEGLRAVEVARQQDGEQPEMEAGSSSGSGNRADTKNLHKPALSVCVDVDMDEDEERCGDMGGSGSGSADASLDSSPMTSPMCMDMDVDAAVLAGTASPGVSSDGGSSPGTPKTRAIKGMKDKIRGMAENEGDMVSQMEQRLGDLEDARVKLQRLQATWNSEYSSLSAAQIQGESEVDTLRHTLFKAENRIGSLEAELASERVRVRQLEKQGVGPGQGVSATTSKALKSKNAKELVAMLSAIKAKDAAAVCRSKKI
jgi:chromosome segregation ATPase